MGCFLSCFSMPENVIELINKSTQTSEHILCVENDDFYDETFRKTIYGWE